jgi:hypothetical protein
VFCHPATEEQSSVQVASSSADGLRKDMEEDGKICVIWIIRVLRMDGLPCFIVNPNIGFGEDADTPRS